MGKSKIRVERFGIQIKRENMQPGLGVLSVVLLIVIGGVIIIGLCRPIWVKPLSSYWGSIIGGLLSGLLTVVGVAWTIRYYRDSDAMKRRVEYMPFLMLEVRGSIEKEPDNVKKVGIFEIYNDDVDKGETLYYLIRVKNIGQGFANTLVIYTGYNFGGMAYNKVIQVNGSDEFYLKIQIPENPFNAGIGFALRYIDCMTNEYTQFYTMEWDSQNLNDVKINSGYPKFICQTHAIGKS